MRVRAVANGNVLTVVDGEPRDSTEVSREVADRLTPLGIFEAVEEAQVGPSTAAAVQPIKRPVGRPPKK